MIAKRFTLNIDSEWWVVGDNTIKVNEFGYRNDLNIEDMGRGLKKELTEQETVDLLNQLYEENMQLKEALKELKEIGDYQALRIKELQEFEDTVFNSFDGKIKRGEKAIEWGESVGADIGSMGFHIELLKQFKKELEE